MLAPSTYAGYRRNVERHIVPALGRIALRRLRAHHLEAFYSTPLRPGDDRVGLAPKTVYEVHLVVRGALTDAVRRALLSLLREMDTAAGPSGGVGFDPSRLRALLDL